MWSTVRGIDILISDQRDIAEEGAADCFQDAGGFPSAQSTRLLCCRSHARSAVVIEEFRCVDTDTSFEQDRRWRRIDERVLFRLMDRAGAFTGRGVALRDARRCIDGFIERAVDVAICDGQRTDRCAFVSRLAEQREGGKGGQGTPNIAAAIRGPVSKSAAAMPGLKPRRNTKLAHAVDRTSEADARTRMPRNVEPDLIIWMNFKV